jgi:hypothetical protein
MESLKIILLCILAAVTYGILQDLITTRVCVEYFTIGHLPIGTEDPTLLAIGWGILATWWVGLGLGLLLAFAARVGSRPRLAMRDLVRPVAITMLSVALAAAIAGMIGYLAAQSGWIFLISPLAQQVPPDKHARFLADGAAHTVAYAAGALGGAVVCVAVWRKRGRMARS